GAGQYARRHATARYPTLPRPLRPRTRDPTQAEPDLFDIPLILVSEGVINGAIYALTALGIVVLYSVTNVINVAQGEFVMLAALTVASLRAQQVPGTVYILMAGLIA